MVPVTRRLPPIPVPEKGDISLVRNNVVGDGCDLDAARRLTAKTKRM
jgi:hypothetical protein